MDFEGQRLSICPFGMRLARTDAACNLRGAGWGSGHGGLYTASVLGLARGRTRLHTCRCAVAEGLCTYYMYRLQEFDSFLCLALLLSFEPVVI